MGDSAKRDYAQLMKNALLELKQLRASLDQITRAQTEPIAIVGMSCRLPGGVDDPDAYWRLLRNGVDAISEVPADRWDAAAYYDANADAPGKIATRFGGFLSTIDEFDPSFFGISPREATSLDPQQRMLLEVSWEALERAGVAPPDLYGTATGVFVGMSTFDYALHQVGGHLEQEDVDRLDGYVATGTTLSAAAGRLSYVLGLNGPSMVVDTACSSSLVATHLAATSLRNRECDMALVGGVNLILRPEWNVNFTKAHMLAPDGRCKTFDASADGYTRGEGCGVVVLQRLSDAIAARRNVMAVIRSSAINQDGASGGLTVPSGPSQEAVIRRALDAAGVRPEEIGYIEAHGTGTSLGDPIEVAAIGAVFAATRTKDAPLFIGSVKTNVGHLEAAAGVAALMKVALSLKHAEIPPHLHFKTPSPFIDWKALPIAVPRDRTTWPSSGTPRRAGISSFGFTGTNAHVVVEEAPADLVSVDDPTSAGQPSERLLHVLTASARSDEALRQLADRYARHFADNPALSLPDVAFTANTGRAQLRHRLAIVADSLAGAQRTLAAFADAQEPDRRTSRGPAYPAVFAGSGSARPSIAFLFTGQGSQYVGMGRQLYESHPVFRSALDRCDEILRRVANLPLLDVLYRSDTEHPLLDETSYTQPALFALEYALAMLWQSWGIEPDAVMGHSVGEYGAACVAGVFSVEDGVMLIAERARLMQALDRGDMVALQTTEARAVEAIARYRRDVSLAAINGTTSVVISGSRSAVSDVVATIEAEGVTTQALRVSHAFHSPLMEPMLADFECVARKVTFSPPKKPIVSNLTGELAGPEIATPDYWVRHVRQPVRFAQGIGTLYQRGHRVFVEIGPGSTLLSLGHTSMPDADAAWLPSLRANSDWEQLLRTLAELYARGAQVDWRRFAAEDPRRPVELPTYPFQRQRYWVDVRRRSPRPDDSSRIDSPEPPASPVETDRAAPVDHLFELAWREQPHGPRVDARADGGRWLLLSGDDRLGAALAAKLRDHGARCAIASPGEGFTQIADDEFLVNPTRSSALDALWTAVTAAGPLRGVVHLCRPDAPSDVDALDGALTLIQQVARQRAEGVPVMWCVTRAACATGHEREDVRLSPAQGAHWGFWRTVALEHPTLWGGLIDLDADEDASRDAAAIARELLASDGEDQIAFRGSSRYVPRVVPRTAVAGSPTIALHPNGAYLVVGGLGALGRHAADWLVSRGARHLVLASRRSADDPAALAAVRELTARGAARVSIATADVSREADVDQLLADIAGGSEPLRGVVHAAGVDAPVALVDMTPEQLQAMLAAKLVGGSLLHDKTRQLPLELFACFSSVSSIWGAAGRAHYAAANASLDTLAHVRRHVGLPALTINWGPWRDGGMASDEDLRALERSGNRALLPATAVRCLDALVAEDASQAIVADIDWPRFRASFEARRRRPLLSEIGGAAVVDAPKATTSRADWVTQLGAVSPDGRKAALEQLLRAEVANILGFASPQQVPLDQSIFELGMDSLRAVELAGRLQQHLGLDRSIQFFDSPQISALATRLLGQVARSDTPSTPPAQPSSTGPAKVIDGLIGYSEECETEIFDFSREAWPYRPEDMIAPRWRWQFVDSARRLGMEPQVWLYRESGRVVAHHAAIPVRLEAGSETIDTAWFADTMVLPSHRRSATGARLIVESNETFSAGLSLGQTDQMREIALRAGWHQVAALPSYVLLLRPRQVLKSKLNPVLAGIASAGLTARHQAQRLRIRGRGQHLEARSVSRFDASHDRLWESIKREYGCAVRRDASYLNWKYVAQPCQTFTRLELRRDGHMVAAAVLAIDDPGLIYKYRRAFIVELVVSPSDARLVAGVLDAIRRHCSTAEVDAIVFHLLNDALEKVVRAYGFTQRPSKRYLLVNPLRVSGEARARLVSPGSWLLTMGDSDIDRPWEVDGKRIQIRTRRR